MTVGGALVSSLGRLARAPLVARDAGVPRARAPPVRADRTPDVRAKSTRSIGSGDCRSR